MAITLVHHAQNVTSSGSSLSVTVTSTTAGNCLVVAIVLANSSGSSNTATVSSVKLGASADNFASLVTVNSGADPESTIWADPNCAGGGTSVVITPSGTTGIMADVYEFSGIAATSPLDLSHTGTGSSGTSWTSGATGTTTQAIEAWVGVAGFHSGGSNTITGPTSPWTSETAQSIGSKFACQEISGYQIRSTTGAATFNGTMSTGGASYSAAVVTLLPGSPASRPTPHAYDLSAAVSRAANW